MNYYQWDFRSYYFGSKIYFQSQNPYKDEILFSSNPYPPQQRFVYPPYTLWFFRIFTLVDYPVAYYIYLYLKCILLAYLIILWSKYFLEKKYPWLFYFFSLLAFNSSLFTDFSSGNVSLLEQSMLWTGFLFYCRKKWLLFSLMVIFSSMFKFTPILFLFLFLATDEKKKIWYFTGSLGVFLLIQISSFLINPEMYNSFLVKLSSLDETGTSNPSLLSLIFDLLFIVDLRTGWEIPSVYSLLVYLLFTLILLLFSLRAFKTLSKIQPNNITYIQIFLTCATVEVLLPRFKIYSYILLLLPAYWILINTPPVKGGILILMALLLSVHTSIPVFDTAFDYLTSYFPYFLGLIVWWLYIRYIHMLETSKSLTNPI